MSDTGNNPTTQTQKVLIGLICVVLVLLLAHLFVGSNSDTLPENREDCLDSGNIWSSSANRCFDAGSDPTTATTALGEGLVRAG